MPNAIEIAASMRKQARLLDRVAEILDPVDESVKRIKDQTIIKGIADNKRFLGPVRRPKYINPSPPY